MELRKLLTSRSPSLWQRGLRGLLWLGSWPYRGVISVRNLLYDIGWKSTHTMEIPVLSVGNLSAGGTGKSPTVAWLARWFRQHDVRVAILSRGYKQLDSGVNDEALELELALPDVPHLQNPDRCAAATLAHAELDMQVLLLDDGFQHRRLARDLDMVLIDASEPACARRLLPGGLFREPLSALRRAHIVLLTRADQAQVVELQALEQRIHRIAPRVLIAHAEHRPAGLVRQFEPMSGGGSSAGGREAVEVREQPLDSLRGRKVLAFCAIGQPQAFVRTLQDVGADVLATHTWPDHHAYVAEDLDRLKAWAADYTNAEMFVCTMKDWVKLQVGMVGPHPLVALRIEMHLARGAAEVERALLPFLPTVPSLPIL